MLEYLSYILFFGVLFVLIIYIYIRLKYGFWVIQPVFHVYDYTYMIKPPGIINHRLPEKNKYTNFKNIETILYSELSQIKQNQFINLIRLHYLRNKDNIFSPKSQNINPYFYGHNASTFISFYNEQTFMMDLKKGTTIEDLKPIGAMTTRPVHVSINNKDADAQFNAYYVDYLCVDQLHRKRNCSANYTNTSLQSESH